MIKKADKAFPKDLPVLTSLRFYAAIFSGLFHIYYLSGLEFPVAMSRIMMNAHLAVDFFFILSGFILTHTYLKAYQAGEFSYQSFLIKRLARIYPVHLLTLSILSLFMFFERSQGWPINDLSNLSDFFQNLLLIQAWGLSDRLSYNIVSWSISAEWFAYIFFPGCVICGLWLKNSTRYVILAAALMAAFWIWFDSKGIVLTQISTAGIFRIIPEFILGVALYFWASENTFPWKNDRAIVLCLLLLIGLFLMNAPEYLSIPLLSATILIGAEQARSGKSRFLCHPTNIYLGQTSYCFYMIQFVIWYMLIKLTKVFWIYIEGNMLIYVAWFLSLILVQLFAILIYRTVEKPCHRWIVNALEIKKLRSEQTDDPLI